MTLHEFAAVWNASENEAEARAKVPWMSAQTFGRMITLSSKDGLLTRPPEPKAPKAPTRRRAPGAGRPPKAAPEPPAEAPPEAKAQANGPGADPYMVWLAGAFAAVGQLSVELNGVGEIRIIARLATQRAELADSFVGRFGGQRSEESGASIIRLNQDDDGLYKLAREMTNWPVYGDLAAKVVPFLESAFWYRENKAELAAMVTTASPGGAVAK